MTKLFSFFKLLAQAVRGSEQDFTQGPIGTAVLLLATPMILEMLMESLFAIVDVFWVTRLGANAIATVGLTESMLTLIFSVALGVSMSTTAMVARRTGEKDLSGASVAATQAILLGVVLALLIGLPAAWFSRELLALMAAPADLIATGHRYTAVVFGGSVSVMLLFLNNAIFRGAGDPALAMRVLIVSNSINLILDPCLIFGIGPFHGLGVTGAALSTLTGRSIGVLYQFWLLTSGHSRIRLHLKEFRLAPKVIFSLIRVSATGVLQFGIAQSSWILLVRIVSAFGSSAVAGYTIGIRMFIFIVLPAWGLSGAAATMVGQNLGAGKPERAQQAVYVTAGYNALYLGLMAIVFIVWPDRIVHVFTSDPTIVPSAVSCLRIISYGNITYAIGMVAVQAFNGAGDTITPTYINFVGFWLCEIPLAWFLAFRLDWRVNGVFASIPLAELLIAGSSIWLFLRGTWKQKKI